MHLQLILKKRLKDHDNDFKDGKVTFRLNIFYCPHYLQFLT